MAFSPLGSTLATWEVYAVKQGEGPKHNLNLWDAKTGKVIENGFALWDSFRQRWAESECGKFYVAKQPTASTL